MLLVTRFYYDCSRECGKVQTLHSFDLVKREVTSISQHKSRNRREREKQKDSTN